MKKVMAAVVLVAASACHRTVATSAPATATRPASTGQVGATDAPGAVRAFLAAAHEQDLQAMSLIWGTQAGPVRDQMPRDEMEKRELILMRCLQHDTYQIVTDSPATSGTRVLAVQLKRKDKTQSTNFTTVQGPSNRWFVAKFNLEDMGTFCQG